MKLPSTLNVVLLSSLLALSGQAASAPIYSTLESSPVQFAGCGGFTCGFAFTANSNLTITRLGVYDALVDGPGFSQPVSAGLWTASGTLLASVTISGTGGDLLGDFRYADITAVGLTAGSSYVLAGFNANFYQTGSGGVNVDPSISITDGRNTSAGLFGQFVMPTSSQGTVIYYGANMFVGSPTQVPEPGSLAMAGVALLGLGAARRARRAAKA